MLINITHAPRHQTYMRDSSYKPLLYNEFILPQILVIHGPPKKLSETRVIKTPLEELRIVIRC